MGFIALKKVCYVRLYYTGGITKDKTFEWLVFGIHLEEPNLYVQDFEIPNMVKRLMIYSHNWFNQSVNTFEHSWSLQNTRKEEKDVSLFPVITWHAVCQEGTDRVMDLAIITKVPFPVVQRYSHKIHWHIYQ